eukprot:6190081-Pleurochrysis_carterae.AAC.4
MPHPSSERFGKPYCAVCHRRCVGMCMTQKRACAHARQDAVDTGSTRDSANCRAERQIWDSVDGTSGDAHRGGSGNSGWSGGGSLCGGSGGGGVSDNVHHQRENRERSDARDHLRRTEGTLLTMCGKKTGRNVLAHVWPETLQNVRR